MASNSAWVLRIDEGDWRSIKVPGGGYNSDLQNDPLIQQRSVKDQVAYKRLIEIPETASGHLVSLAFGAVNHGCDIYLEEQLVGSHVGPLMPFDVDITDYVEPGNTYELQVVCYPQWHYDYKVPHGFIYGEAREHPATRGWGSKFGYGITKYIRIEFHPEAHIKDLFVRPSVAEDTLTYDLWVHNHTPETKSLTLQSDLTSWNEDPWQYPRIEPVDFTIQAGETHKLSVGPMPWNLGPRSYWWPNKPFREDYRTTLHNLNVALIEGGSVVDRETSRFGFVEWTEGTNYYMVNGVRVNQISDGTPESAMSDYDAYSQSPAFLPPSNPSTGLPETWKRYMRLGISANRTHQSTPTQYMMDVADELGFMLIPESAIRGSQRQDWSDEYLPQAVRELARTCRNHPSVSRYSLLNETKSVDQVRSWIPILIDAILEEDSTRPLVFEDNQIDEPVRIEGSTGHAHAMLHYVDYPRPAESITGVGEFAWEWIGRKDGPPHSGGGLEEFIYYGGDMRRWDIVYIAGWDFINYWPNFLEGMNYERHAWKQSCYPKDRIDGVDGWGSPVVKWAERYFHPYLVLDLGIHEMNPPDSDSAKWPEFTSSHESGSMIMRELEIFNDGLRGDKFAIQWEARWDSPQGPLVVSGQLETISIEPGFHRTVNLTMPSPQTDRERKLFLVLKSLLDGREVFVEDDIYFWIKG